MSVAGCTALESIPEAPALDWLDISDCTRLSRLPDLPALEKVSLDGCDALQELPLMPKLKRVHTKDRAALVERWPELARFAPVPVTAEQVAAWMR